MRGKRALLFVRQLGNRTAQLLLLVLLFGFLTGIPDLQRLVKATTDNSLAIRTERHASDMVSMSLERLQFFASVGIPDLQRIVITTTDNSLAIRAEGHAHELFSLSVERL